MTDYLNYGGNNVIAVRVDASIEEGWFYEGAGIYRHVWLNKTSPLHITTDGPYVTTEVKYNSANVHAQVTIINQFVNNKTVDIQQTIVDATGKTIYVNLNEPTDKLPALTNVTDMSVGALHQVAQRQDGGLYTWGWSFEGSLGGGATTTNIWMYNVPIAIKLP